MSTAPVGSEHRITLPPDPASASAARRWLREVLLPGGHEDWLDTAELACTELVTNAVLHAHTPVEVSVRVGEDELLVEVHDRSPTLPVQRAYDSLSTTGRGMGLVAALVAEHGIRDAGPRGKTAWFLLRGHAPAAGPEDLLAAWDDDAWDSSAWDEATREAVLEAAGSAAGTGLRVRLLGIPPTLWFAAREHHDTILRELALHLADRDARGGADRADRAERAERAERAGADLAAADLARGTVSTALWSTTRAGGGAGPAADRAPGATEAPTDLEVLVPADVVDAFGRLQDTLDLAERLAAAGELFTPPALPEVVAVRDWACEQVQAQHAGAPPLRWAGADQERFLDARPPDGTAGWDLDAVRDDVRGVAAADHRNRVVAVSRPLARLAGYEPEDLVGRRVVALVPPRLREAHVAGVTRHLATGETRLTGTPGTLPLLRADGTEVLCRVLLEQVHDGVPGRYLAWIEPETDHLQPGAL